MSSRPSSFPEWATAPSGGDVVEPSEAKKESGWRKVASVAEKPPYEHFNWWQNLVNQWCEFANEAMPSGVVSSFAGSTVPEGWLLCNGAAISQTTYAGLYAAIGTTWDECTNPLTGAAYAAPGAGDFRLPDLRGAFVRGVGTFSDARDTALAGFQANLTSVNGLAHSSSTTNITSTSSSDNAHTHTVSGGSDSVSHTHTLTAGTNAGTHTHTASGGTDAAGAHSHTSNMYTSWSGSGTSMALGGQTAGIQYTDSQVHTHTVSISSGTATHTHTFTMTAANDAHSHTMTGYSDTRAAHTHTISGTVAVHTHTVSGDAETRPINVGLNFIIKV